MIRLGSLQRLKAMALNPEPLLLLSSIQAYR